MISDGNDSDNDTITINETAATVPAGTITGVENIDVELESFSKQTVNAGNFVDGTLTLTQTQTGGAQSVDVEGAAAPLSIVAGSGITDTLTVNTDGGTSPAGATIDGGSASTVAVNELDSDGASITATEDATVNLSGTTNPDDSATVAATSSDGNNVDLDAAVSDLVETLTLSGNGGSVAFKANDGGAPTDVTATGDQDVTYENKPGDLDGNTINNNLTSGTFTVVASGGAPVDANDIDLTNADADVFEIALDNATNEIKVEDGDNVRFSANQGDQVTISAGSTGDNTLNLNLRADASNLLVTNDDFGTVNLDVENNDDTTDTRTIDTTSSFGANTTVNVTGSDDLDVGDVTADVIDANGFTGALTATLSANNGDITGGFGDDVFSGIGNAAATVSGGEGEDVFTIAAEGSDVTINGGADTDTVKLGTSVNFSDDATTPAALDLNGVEILDFDDGNTLTVDGSEIDGSDLIVRSSGGTNDNFTVNLGSNPSVDLSNLTVNTGEVDVVVNGTGVSDTVTGSNDGDDISGAGGDDVINAGAGADNVTGGTGADDISGGAGSDVTLAGGAGDDTIDGGAGDDVIDGGDGSDTLTGGTGNDTFEFNATNGFTNDNGNTVTDFTAGGNDDKLDDSGANNFQEAVNNATDISNSMSVNVASVDGANEIVDNGLEIVVDGSGSGNTAASLSTDDVATFLGDVDGDGNAFQFDAGTNGGTSDGDINYIAVSDGTDTGIFLADESSDDATVDSGELTNVVTLQGVSDPTNLTADDFTGF